MRGGTAEAWFTVCFTEWSCRGTISVSGEGRGNVTEATMIIQAKTKEPPKYRKTAAELLEKCREFYRNPENEKAFREWKAGKEAKK